METRGNSGISVNQIRMRVELSDGGRYVNIQIIPNCLYNATLRTGSEREGNGKIRRISGLELRMEDLRCAL